MHILLTDRLACPRCGPEFGLILLADAMTGRQVRSGSLGCPNCRDRFPIQEWVADLRPPPREPSEADSLAPAEDDEAALRLAAFLGLTGGPGQVALVGTPAVHANALADRVDEIFFVALEIGSCPPLTDGPPPERVSRARVSGVLPLFSASLRGIALSEGGRGWVTEALRVTAPGGRIVGLGLSSDSADALRASAQEVLLDQDGVLVIRR